MKKIAQLFRLAKMIGVKNLLKMSSVHKGMLKYARSYMTIQCVMALEKIGFLERLSVEKSVDIASFSTERGLDFQYLKAICEYLYVLGILEKEQGAYAVSAQGEGFLERTRGTFYFIHAYAPLFEDLACLLKKEKEYKKDIFRREKYVAEATADVAQWIPIPAVRRIIGKHDFKRILDLGCGSARFLIQLCEEPGLTCVGIDIAEESIEHGKELVRRSGLEDRIDLMVGDIFEITSKSRPGLEKIDVMISMYVLHEFLYEGRSALIDFLADLKARFPGKYLLVCELARQDPDKMRHSPTAIAEHHLFHAISQQGLISSEEWLEVFKEAGYSCVETMNFDFAGQSYFLLK